MSSATKIHWFLQADSASAPAHSRCAQMSFEYTERTRWGVLSKVSEIRSKHGGWSKVSETGTGNE